MAAVNEAHLDYLTLRTRIKPLARKTIRRAESDFRSVGDPLQSLSPLPDHPIGPL